MQHVPLQWSSAVDLAKKTSQVCVRNEVGDKSLPVTHDSARRWVRDGHFISSPS